MEHPAHNGSQQSQFYLGVCVRNVTGCYRHVTGERLLILARERPARIGFIIVLAGCVRHSYDQFIVQSIGDDKGNFGR